MSDMSTGLFHVAHFRKTAFFEEPGTLAHLWCNFTDSTILFWAVLSDEQMSNG